MISDQLAPDGAPLPLIRVVAETSSAETDAIPHGTIDPQRLRTVLYRIASGFYDSIEVRDRIAIGAVKDLP